MADYYVILKRAVDGLPDSTRDKRQAIYDKARKALLTQLQNMDPPLAPADISKQRMALEEAVRSVERDLDQAAKSAQSPQETSEVAAPSVEISDDNALPTSVDPVVEKKVEGPAAAPEVVASKDTGGPEMAEIAKGPTPSTDNPSASDKVVRRAGQDVLKNAVRDANALGAATNAAVKSAQDAADAVGEQRDNDVARIEPTLGDVVVSDQKTYQRNKSDKPAVAEATNKSLADPLGEDEPKSRFGMVAGALLLTGFLAGSGYLLYENRDAFMTPDNGSNGDQQSEVVTDPSPEDTTDNAAGQTTDQTTQDTGIPAKEVRTVTVGPPSDTQSTQEPATSESVDNNAAPDSTTEPVATSEPAPAAEGQETPASTETASEQQGQAAIAPPRSILYEEEGPKGEPGTATGGDTVWTLEGTGADAAILISAKIPEQKVSYEIKIAKNSDAELPASHLIEISALREGEDGDRAISNIPGLILKPTEQSRGEGLVGAAIKIADDLHWIALTAGEKEEKYNLELLALRSWIDIPIQYATGRRAILTLEKGTLGEKVVEDAIKAWGG